MATFKPELETCPICESCGNCHVHDYYGRQFIDFQGNNRTTDDLCITRVMCDNCEHTHAILPDIIIPYSSYGLIFVLTVLVIALPAAVPLKVFVRNMTFLPTSFINGLSSGNRISRNGSGFYAILNDIKMLMIYGYDSINCFTLILCGESHLNDTLQKPVHEAVRQRVTVHYNYSVLSDDEVSKYILHKLQLAGASSSIIDTAALAATHSFTQGNPRIIDNLMTDALTLGAQQKKTVIDAEIIRAAVDNQGLY